MVTKIEYVIRFTSFSVQPPTTRRKHVVSRTLRTCEGHQQSADKINLGFGLSAPFLVAGMAFITQRGEMAVTLPRSAKQRETSELEALVSGVNSVSQATLLLKKMKEVREVDDALDFMKEQYSRRMASCDERQKAFELRQV